MIETACDLASDEESVFCMLIPDWATNNLVIIIVQVSILNQAMQWVILISSPWHFVNTSWSEWSSLSIKKQTLLRHIDIVQISKTNICQEVDTAETESAMLTDELKFQKFQHEHISAAHDTKVMLTGKDIPRVGKVLDLLMPR